MIGRRRKEKVEVIIILKKEIIKKEIHITNIHGQYSELYSFFSTLFSIFSISFCKLIVLLFVYEVPTVGLSGFIKGLAQMKVTFTTTKHSKLVCSLHNTQGRSLVYTRVRRAFQNWYITCFFLCIFSHIRDGKGQKCVHAIFTCLC